MEVHGFSIREEEIVYSPWKHGVAKTDLSTEKRQQVIDYVQKKYGEVFNVRTVSDLQDKGAVVKAAKFLGMTHSEATKLSKNINSVDDLEEGAVKEYAKHFVGRLNAYGKHASAVAVFPRDHTEWCSVEKQGEDKVAAQDFHIMEKQGLLKLDLLGLTTLDIIQQCIEHINDNFDINKIDYADPLTAKLLQAGNTDGVFQVESQTMTGLIQGIKAKDVRDLSAVVALGRPAILDMNLEKTFIKRRNGEETVEYKDPKLEPILKETEGLMLYQEQVMKVVQVMCGYSLGEADNVRRVIGRKVKEAVAEIKADIIKRGVALGNNEGVMKDIGDEVEAFASYGLNKAHSLAYAMTAWRTAYLKAHYPCEFMAAVLDANREDKEKFSYYISSCEKMGIEVRPPCVDSSSSICTPIPKENAIQLGFSCIAGVKNKKVDTNITDAKQYLEEHSTYNKTVLAGLVKSGALDKFSDCSRPELLEYVEWVKDKRKSRPDFAFSGKEVESNGLMEFSVLGYAFTDVFSEFNLDWLPFGAVAAIITSVKAHKTRKGKPMAFVKADIRGQGVQELVIFDDTFKNLEKGKCYALKLRDTIINDFTEIGRAHV